MLEAGPFALAAISEEDELLLSYLEAQSCMDVRRHRVPVRPLAIKVAAGLLKRPDRPLPVGVSRTPVQFAGWGSNAVWSSHFAVTMKYSGQVPLKSLLALDASAGSVRGCPVARRT